MKRQNQVDGNDPEEHALWVTGCLNTAHDQITMAEPDARAISKQLWEAGFRHDPELQTHKFVGVGTGLVMGARWLPVDEDEETPADEVPDLSGLSLAHKTEIARQLAADGILIPEVVDEP